MSGAPPAMSHRPIQGICAPLASTDLLVDPLLARWTVAHDHDKSSLLFGPTPEERRDCHNVLVMKKQSATPTPPWVPTLWATTTSLKTKAVERKNEGTGLSRQKDCGKDAEFSALPKPNFKFNVGFKWYERIPEFVANSDKMAAQ